MPEIRVRFAPSPTGPLHIGGLRTALYNYLFARKHKGVFVLRIEDTDQTRYVRGAEDYIIESLKWCGLIPDEGVSFGGDYGPYRQSERKDIYRGYAEELIKKGAAYYAFDTPEELENYRKEAEARKETFMYDSSVRTSLKNSLSLNECETKNLLASGVPYVIRFKFPENEIITFKDIIRGEINVNSSQLDDKILFKSDGMPTYHLANITDDHLMKISHVIRGEEWLPSLPLHVSMYRAFGWEDSMPEFAHLPLILKPDGKGKLSKRDGDKGGFPVFPLEWVDPDTLEKSSGYRESGYFPEACLNILAFLGWNPGTEQELFSLDQLVDAFTLEKTQKAGAKFDPDKARWYNHQYLQKKSDEEITELFMPVLKENNIDKNTDYVKKVISLVKERADFIKDLWKHSDFFFVAPNEYDQEVIKKRWKEESPGLLTGLLEVLRTVMPFNSSEIETSVKKWMEKEQISSGQLMPALRLSLVGTSRGPAVFDIISLLGYTETEKRIKQAIEKIT